MAEVVLFHHAHGLNPGVGEFADTLRAAGHAVHTPDLFDGRTFDDLEAGVAHAESIGFEELADKGLAAVIGLGEELVYAGFSLGVLPAQKLAQTRPGARGALLYHATLPMGFFGDSWPAGVPVQIHFMADDPWAAEDLAAAEALRDEAGAELFVYPGSGHLFADSGLSDYDADAARLLIERTLAFLTGPG